MGVYPANGHNLLVDLGLEEAQFVCHEASVDIAFLHRNDQGVYEEGVSFVDLSTC